MKPRTFLCVAILVLAAVTWSCRTIAAQETEHPLIMEEELAIEGPQGMLYWLADRWMEQTLPVSGGSVVHRDAGTGLLVGQGVAVQVSRAMFDSLPYEFPFRLAVKVSEGLAGTRLEVGLGKAYFSESVSIMVEPHLMPPEDYGELKGGLASMIDDLFGFLARGCQAYQYAVSGIARGEEGDFEGAVIEYSKGIALLSDWSALYSQRGLARVHIGDLEGALADCDQAVRLDPAEPSLYFYRGNIKAMTGDLWGAIGDFTAAAELAPDNPVPLNQRGWTYIKLGRYPDAVSDLDRAIALGRAGPRGVSSAHHDTRGWAYFYLGRYREAREDALAALQLDPEACAPRALLFRIEVRDDPERAAASLKQYVSDLKRRGSDDPYLLVLQYLADELPLERLEEHPMWDDLRVTLRNYRGLP
ncbi:MAG: tetratricopeptide repeat protein [Spirochaetaceae bacterium]|nr:MAG: tetratricopeptide repeat protein [Spirochaetaceae bacterium]